MFLNLDSTIVLLFLGLLVLVVLFFLPAIIELKRPRDSGPRVIEKNLPSQLFRSVEIVQIANIEDEQKPGSFIGRSIVGLVEVLPNLET